MKLPLGVSLAVASKAPAAPAPIKLVATGGPPPPPVLRPVAKAPTVVETAAALLTAPRASVVDKNQLLKEPKPIVVQKSAASEAIKGPAAPVQKLAPTTAAAPSKASYFGEGPPASAAASMFASPDDGATTAVYEEEAVYDDDRGAVGVSVEAPDFVWKAAAAIGIAIGAWMFWQKKQPRGGRR